MTERKFKVGDRVQFTNEFAGYPEGFVAEVVALDRAGNPATDKSSLGGPNRDPWPAHILADNTVAVGGKFISPHYTENADGKDYLQRFFENESPESVRGAMVFTIGKYIERLGKKDAPEKELAKVIDYATRYRNFLLTK